MQTHELLNSLCRHQTVFAFVCAQVNTFPLDALQCISITYPFNLCWKHYCTFWMELLSQYKMAMEQGLSTNGKKCYSISAYDSTEFTRDGLLHCSSAPRWHYYCNINRHECQFSISNFRWPSLFSKLTWILCTKLLGLDYCSPKKPWVSNTQENASRIFLCGDTVYSPTNSTYNYKEFGSSCWWCMCQAYTLGDTRMCWQKQTQLYSAVQHGLHWSSSPKKLIIARKVSRGIRAAVSQLHKVPWSWWWHFLSARRH